MPSNVLCTHLAFFLSRSEGTSKLIASGSLLRGLFLSDFALTQPENLYSFSNLRDNVLFNVL
jgi:hypothetical protein